MCDLVDCKLQTNCCPCIFQTAGVPFLFTWAVGADQLLGSVHLNTYTGKLSLSSPPHAILPGNRLSYSSDCIAPRTNPHNLLSLMVNLLHFKIRSIFKYLTICPFSFDIYSYKVNILLFGHSEVVLTSTGHTTQQSITLEFRFHAPRTSPHKILRLRVFFITPQI